MQTKEKAVQMARLGAVPRQPLSRWFPYQNFHEFPVHTIDAGSAAQLTISVHYNEHILLHLNLDFTV